MTTPAENHLMYATLATGIYRRGYDSDLQVLGNAGDTVFVCRLR